MAVFRWQQGPAAASGVGSAVTRIDVPVASATWVLDIGRDLGSVMVVDSAGAEVEPGDVQRVGTALHLTFSAAFSGTAYVVG